jgi:hypothetical protein
VSLGTTFDLSKEETKEYIEQRLKNSRGYSAKLLFIQSHPLFTDTQREFPG